MRVHVGALRPVVAGLVAGLTVLGAAQPAVAAPRRAEQWYLDELRIDRAHQISTGRGVVVGLVDTGVEADHPDLRGQVLRGASTRDTGDGRRDPDGHGTHMAGIIAANGAGVEGIAPDARILPIRKPPGTSFTVQDSATGIRMAVDGGARVINLSYGTTGAVDEGEVAAVRYALERDVVVVAGAGNVRQLGPDIAAPAKFPGVIAVTGTSRGGGFWSGSAQGPEAVVAAPGDEVYNIGRGRGYGWGDGTSDSSAIVSGVAALIRSKYPKLSAPDVINRIIRTARDAGPPGRDPRYGFGRIDPVAALTADVPSVSANPLLGGATAAPGTSAPAAAAEDDNFDVTKYGDRGGPTDQQVMVVGIGIAVALVVLLALVGFLIWNRRRHRRELARAGDIPDEVLDRMDADGQGPPVPAGHAPPGPYPQPGSYPRPGPGGYSPSGPGPSPYAPPPGPRNPPGDDRP